MSRAKTKNAELAELVADKIAEQVRQLAIDNWPDIQKTMDADENREIKLAFSSQLTHREAEPGAVASKDSRIKTTLSFSLGKASDSKDSPFPEVGQMDLGEKA